MTGNVISFPGGEGGGEPPRDLTADEILTSCLGKYEEVLIVGLNANKGQLITTLGLEDSVYELSRAIYKLHGYLEGR